MKFIWGPQEILQHCVDYFARPHAHIAIRSPGTRERFPVCGDSALLLQFHDLDPAAIRQTQHYKENPEEGDLLIDGCFEEEHAIQIDDFVRIHMDKLIVVNCEAGISRSAGVVLALREFYLEDADEVYRKAIPNIHVATVLRKVLAERAFSRGC